MAGFCFCDCYCGRSNRRFQAKPNRWEALKITEENRAREVRPTISMAYDGSRTAFEIINLGKFNVELIEMRRNGERDPYLISTNIVPGIPFIMELKFHSCPDAISPIRESIDLYLRGEDNRRYIYGARVATICKMGKVNDIHVQAQGLREE